MNICFIGSYTSGGTERATFLVANELNKKNEIFILNTTNREPFFKLKGIKMDYLKSGSLLNRIFAFTKYLKENKIDVVVSVESLTGIYSMVATKLANCKHIVWEHANFYQNQGSANIQKIRQIEVRTADAYVVLTKRDKDNFEENFKIKCKLQNIYNIAEDTVSSNYDINSKSIISAGYIRKIKNFIVIPEIGKIVFSKYPDWSWKIFGPDTGEQYEAVKEKIKEYGLQNNILLCGRSNNMNEEYSQAAMYVMTSLQEGLPMTLLEAKSNGLPLISFDIETGPSEIIDDGVNGFLIPPYDVEKMADKICELIENDELRQSFSNHAKDGLEKFNKESIVNSWEKLLKEI